MRQMQAEGGAARFSFGKSRARMIDESNNNITFADVAGCEEAKDEVAELVDFLRDPAKFQKLGGRIPRACSCRQPRTGKTLLARAIAGEAKVPFFSIRARLRRDVRRRGGRARARHVRSGEEARACIVFIDEIDAVGRQRGAGLGGGNDEREQTLNQLLVEMDGFEGTTGVIVIARPTAQTCSTRRSCVPAGSTGRSSCRSRTSAPRADPAGAHEEGPVAPDVKAEIIARGTPGFSGADLANLVNEAALFAARKNKRLVDMDDFRARQDKIVMARSAARCHAREERRNTAYHESGHAVVAKLLPKTDPVHKVTIIPRGRALGVTCSCRNRTGTAWTGSGCSRRSRSCSAGASPRKCSWAR